MKPRKIAISQLIDNKRVLSMALSIVSNFQLIQNRTQYEWQRQFNINDSLLKNWYNQSLIISASFINRVESETGLTEFISNGASFSEILMLKATNKGGKILNKQEEQDKKIETHKSEKFNELNDDVLSTKELDNTEGGFCNVTCVSCTSSFWGATEA